VKGEKGEERAGGKKGVELKGRRSGDALNKSDKARTA